MEGRKYQYQNGRSEALRKKRLQRKLKFPKWSGASVNCKASNITAPTRVRYLCVSRAGGSGRHIAIAVCKIFFFLCDLLLLLAEARFPPLTNKMFRSHRKKGKPWRDKKKEEEMGSRKMSDEYFCPVSLARAKPSENADT